MTRAEALALVLSTASQWAENAEEAFPHRLRGDETEEELRQLATIDGVVDDYELEDAKEIRDVWAAIKILTEGGSDVEAK